MQKPIAGNIRKKGKYYYYTYQKDGMRYLDVALKETEFRKAIKKANDIYNNTINPDELTPNSIAPLLYRYLDREMERVQKNTLTLPTYNEKRRILTTHVLNYFGQNRDVTKLTVLDIEDYCDCKLETLSNNTVVKHYHYLNAFFKYLCKIDTLIKNVVDLADHPGRTKSETPDTLTKEEVAQYLTHLEKDEEVSLSFKIAIVNTLLGGMRRGEAISIKADSVSFIKDPKNPSVKYVKVLVKDTITTSDNEVIYKDTKSHKERQVVLPPFATHFYAQAIAERSKRILQFGVDRIGEYIAGDDFNHNLHPDWFTRENRRLLKKYNMRYVSLRGFRHTRATLLHASGADLKSISDLLGHSTIKITADIYTHPGEDIALELANMVNF